MVLAKTRKGEGAPELPREPDNGGIPATALMAGLRLRTALLWQIGPSGPSVIWLELLFNQGCHMGPVGSGSLPGNKGWPASRPGCSTQCERGGVPVLPFNIHVAVKQTETASPRGKREIWNLPLEL